MTKVKICGITNLEDALVSLESGAYALGFNFYKRSSRYVEPRRARKIIEQLPAGILSVGVFVNEPNSETVIRLADEAGVDAIQLHGDESPDYCRALKDRYVIKALRVDPEFSLESVLQFETQAILLDTPSTGSYGGTGRTFDWSRAREIRKHVPKLFLAGGLSPENVREAIALVDPFAVDACSCLEFSPGHKDHELLHAFLQAARTHVKP
jgi:phosphoribosylanthranilate isomerase